MWWRNHYITTFLFRTKYKTNKVNVKKYLEQPEWLFVVTVYDRTYKWVDNLSVVLCTLSVSCWSSGLELCTFLLWLPWSPCAYCLNSHSWNGDPLSDTCTTWNRIPWHGNIASLLMFTLKSLLLRGYREWQSVSKIRQCPDWSGPQKSTFMSMAMVGQWLCWVRGCICLTC